MNIENKVKKLEELEPLSAPVNVLLVDDKIENLITLETLLTTDDEKIHFISKTSGEEALKVAIKEDLALILMDVQMPGMDGYEVAKILKRNSKTKNIPIVFVTAIYQESDSVLEGFEAGAVDYLFKPLNPNITKAKVRAFINLYKQQKELEQKNLLLKEKQQTINEINSLANLGIWEWDLRNNDVNCSEELYKIFDFERNKKISFHDILNAIPKEDRESVEKAINKTLESKEYSFFNHRFISKDNTSYIFGKCKAFFGNDGNPIKLKGYSQDITPLKESENLIFTVLNSSMTGIMALKAIKEDNQIKDFEWVLTNDSAQIILDRNNLIGKKLLEEMPGNKEEGLFNSYISVVETEKPFETEHYYTHEGLQKWFHIIAMKRGDGIVVNFADITQRKQSEEKAKKASADLAKAHYSLVKLKDELEQRVIERTSELEKAEKDLRASNHNLRRINTDLDNFIYTASHDLKAPINNIEGLIETLKLEIPEDNEDTNTILTMIYQSINRFKNTIKDLTDITRLENDSFADLSSNELKPLIEEVKLNLKDLINKNGAQIQEFLEVPNITFSKKNLRSILYNLISNAIKYRSKDRSPEVIIKSYQIDSHSVLSVKDNGLGIRKDDISKVFGMFKRLHDHVEGTGVGMYLVKRMVENLGGKIEVDSELGKGSEFKIYFKHQEVS